MVINEQRHTLFGPGGSARRLHPKALGIMCSWVGAKQARREDKGCSITRYGSVVIWAKMIVANDNYAPVAVAA